MSKVFIVDSANLHRKGLALLVGEHYPAGMVEDFEDLLAVRRRVNAERPDLVIASFHRYSPEALEELKGFIHAFQVPTILIGSASWLVGIQELCRAGLAGIVCNLANPSELSRAIVAVKQRKQYVCPEFGKYLLEKMLTVESRTFNNTKLSKRELEVITLLFQDRSEAEIAKKLHISSSTVKSHKERIYSKLGIHSKVELVHFCYRNNLVS